ncbi:MAG: adenylate/guanylate cyclase domain-containing protein, partial [Treponema sp.]|nr:adenylate/guanylate cyclase domain-containing protein [Treponema sp.]
MGSKKTNRRELDKIHFSIGAKLITIISFIVVFSLGSITALVSWLVYNDLRITAEEDNFETNRRSAMEAEAVLTNVRSNSRILIQTITSLSAKGNDMHESVDFFFAENPQIAAVYYASGGEDQLLINSRFFSFYSIDEEKAASFIDSQRASLARSVRGETLLQNASPHFKRSLTAMFFPWQTGGAGAVLFSSDNINNNFNFGVNKSFMLNSDGDILAHADYEFVREGMNI